MSVAISDATVMAEHRALSLTQITQLVDERRNTIILERCGTNEKLLQTQHLSNPLVTSIAVGKQKRVVVKIDDKQRFGEKLDFRSKASEHTVAGQLNLLDGVSAAGDPEPLAVT